MKIKISGIIVGVEYDCGFWEEEIVRGYITPESRFNSILAKATGPLDIEINSYGGSVWAAASMEAAVKAWRAANPKAPLTITVTGIALSAAAGLLAALHDIATIRAYSGAQIMFHSCSSYTVGGPGAHQDAVTQLNNYNKTLVENLLATSSYPENEIKGWLEEGRAGWLTAKDAAAHGLIHEIIDAKAVPTPKPSQDDAKVMMQRGRLDLAACFAAPQMSLLDAIAQTAAQGETGETGEDPRGDDGDQEDDAQGEDGEQEGDAQGDEGEQEDDAQGDEPEPEDDAQASEKEIAELKAENEVLAQQIDALKADLAAAKSKLGKLTQGFKAPQPRQSAPADWATAVKTIQDENPTWKRDSCVIEARSRYKELFASLTGRQA